MAAWNVENQSWSLEMLLKNGRYVKQNHFFFFFFVMSWNHQKRKQWHLIYLLLHLVFGCMAFDLRSPLSQLYLKRFLNEHSSTPQPLLGSLQFMICVLTWIYQPSLWLWGLNRFLHLHVNSDTLVFPLALRCVLRKTRT